MVKFIKNIIKNFDNFFKKQRHLEQVTDVYVNKLHSINENLEFMLDEQTIELKDLKNKILDKEKKLIKQKKLLDSQEVKLKSYINKVFEQQERERIVRFLVNSIRESLDLETVLSTIVNKVGKLFYIDKCLIALYNNKQGVFEFYSEYLSKDNKKLKANSIKNFNISDTFFNHLLETSYPYIVEDRNEIIESKIEYYKIQSDNIKSFVMAPIVHDGEMLGLIIVENCSSDIEWSDSQIETLNDICHQVAIAIKQAYLYTKTQEATKLKSEFLAGMSHEFRTPLNAIISFSDMLIGGNYGNFGKKQQRYLSNISKSGKHLLNLVNDILDLSKIEAGVEEITYSNFNVKNATEEVLSILEGKAKEKNITIEKDLVVTDIEADNRRFKQILYNLLSNSIKFSNNDSIINITSIQNDGILYFEIQDYGIGICEKDKHKIFENFRQLDSSYSRKEEGTGLGLSLTKKLVKLHNGEIGFDSKENIGSKFWFKIPLSTNKVLMSSAYS